MGDIRTFVGASEMQPGDYYLMTEDGQELYGATHHDGFFPVDIRPCAPISEAEFHGNTAPGLGLPPLNLRAETENRGPGFSEALFLYYLCPNEQIEMKNI